MVSTLTLRPKFSTTPMDSAIYAQTQKKLHFTCSFGVLMPLDASAKSSLDSQIRNPECFFAHPAHFSQSSTHVYTNSHTTQFDWWFVLKSPSPCGLNIMPLTIKGFHGPLVLVSFSLKHSIYQRRPNYWQKTNSNGGDQGQPHLAYQPFQLPQSLPLGDEDTLAFMGQSLACFNESISLLPNLLLPWHLINSGIWFIFCTHFPTILHTQLLVLHSPHNKYSLPQNCQA